MENQFNKKKPAFTLIELVVTITIIGIISAILAAPLMNMAKKARVMADIRTIQGAQKQIEFYITENDGAYPATSPVPASSLTAKTLPVGMWTELGSKSYISSKDIKGDELILQTKLNSLQIPIKYDNVNQHIYMELPEVATVTATDEKLAAIVTGFANTEEGDWCRFVEAPKP